MATPSGYYMNASMDDPSGPTEGSNRVRRGGGGNDPARLCRSAFRHGDNPGGTAKNLGFRVSLILPDSAAERGKMSRAPDAPQPSTGTAAKKPSPVAEITNSIGMKLVLIPAGEFLEGTDKAAQRKRFVEKAFYAGVCEVTNQQFAKVMGVAEGDNPTNAHGGTSWLDAVEFCNRLSKAENLPPYYQINGKTVVETGSCGYRLPSALEWDYAAAAADESTFAFNGEARDAFGFPSLRPTGVSNSFGLRKTIAFWEYESTPGSFRMWIEPEKPRKSGYNNGLECHADDLSFRVVRDSDSSPAAGSLSADSSLVGADGKWKLPPGAPSPAIAPFDAQKAKEHQEGWAKHLGVPVEMTNSIGMKLAVIPPGEFMMGSPKELIEEELKTHGDNQWYKERLPTEGPQHHVRITRPYYFGLYVVTQEEYQRVMGHNPSEFSAMGTEKDKVAGKDTNRFPVENISWDDAMVFCRKLSNLPEEEAAGRIYRLPSEAQWEYACRAGSTGRYSFSLGENASPEESEEEGLSGYGWFDGNSGGMIHAVGGKRANVWGFYDMHGNVWQWCQDWWDKDYYAKSVTDDPAGPVGGTARVLRGGSWIHHPAWQCRSACRNSIEPGARGQNVGFRVVLNLADKPPKAELGKAKKK